MNIPNTLTVFRILLIPLLVVVFFLPFSWSYSIAAGIFVLAAATDWLDGYLARKLNQQTPFGAFLDPVADKLIVVVALVLLVNQQNSIWFTVPSLIIVGREILVSALREWMAEVGNRTSVAVSYVGKLKTAMQMVAIVLLLAIDPDRNSRYLDLAYALYYVASILTIWSALIYLRAAWPELMASATTDDR